ncbi:MAG TPA: flavin reductase family protein [Nitrososphaerales archaeon]|nr:flavin reductase family protein [Nitrososphaerales archaeon]
MKSVDPAKAYRLFYPAVPAILACSDRSLVYAMPVVSVIPLSNIPPLVGVASSPQHSTHQAIVKVGRFSLCWVDASLVRALEVLGTTPHTAADKLRAAGLEHHPGRTLDVPIVEGVVATAECSLYARQAFGDHELLVGKVQDARAAEDFQDYWRFQSYKPVLYAGIQEGAFKTFQPRAGE